MQITDDTLMAYADGELDEATRSAVERAIAADATLAERARGQSALGARVRGAYDSVLAEPLPERLLQAAQTPARADAAQVTRLDDARVAQQPRRAWRWAADWTAWGGMAASVLLGVLIGKTLPSEDHVDAAFATQAGQLLAEGAVAQALTKQPASAPVPIGAVAVQLSFVDKAGAYCRTFTTTGMAGVACRSGSGWAVQSLTHVETAATDGMRQAASALPPAILDEVDRRIQGSALDAPAEQAAIQQGWRR